MITIDEEIRTPTMRFMSFGALALPHHTDCAYSVVARDGHVDTAIVSTGTGRIALNLYAATSSGTVPGYLGSCLRYLNSENVDTNGVDWIPDSEVGGTAPDGTHYRFLNTSAPGWLLRAAVQTPLHAAKSDLNLARQLLNAARVHAPRHLIAGTVIELDVEPAWFPGPR